MATRVSPEFPEFRAEIELGGSVLAQLLPKSTPHSPCVSTSWTGGAKASVITAINMIECFASNYIHHMDDSEYLKTGMAANFSRLSANLPGGMQVD